MVDPSLSTWSESDFHRRLRELLVRSDERVAVGIGDDLAALRHAAGDLLLVGIDQVLEGVHFTAQTDLADVGRKAVNRNLSDCAAMACLPTAAVVSIAVPRGFGAAKLERLSVAMRDALASFDATLVGGDTGSWPGPLAITVAILGRSAGIEPVTRRGAKPGDLLAVTGPLGGSILGRHLSFEPRVALARELASRVSVHAMLDLSDGLSRDLPRLCEASHVGATLDGAAIPIHADARRLPGDALDHALHDGEDYELLFAFDPSERATVESLGATVIGSIDAPPGVRIGRDGAVSFLAPLGYDHAL